MGKKYISNWKTQLGVATLLFLGFFFVGGVAHAFAAGDCQNLTSGSITAVLQDNCDMQKLWKLLINVLNSFVIVIMMFVAFCEILRIDVNTYGMKKILPTLILAVVAANFSWILVRVMVDVSNVVMTFFTEKIAVTSAGTAVGAKPISVIDPLGSARGAININFGSTCTTGDTNCTSFFGAVIKVVFTFAGAIALYILAFLMFIRNWVVYLLAIVSGAAFMAMAFPASKNLFNTWWKQLIQWIFMPVVSVGLLWFAGKVIAYLGTSTSFMALAFALAAVYGAVTIPFKMGGAIAGQWGKLGGKAWGATGGWALKQTGTGISKGAGWAAGGGVQSWMAARNQMAAKRAAAVGNKDEESRLKAKANRWTMANPRAWREALAARFKASGEFVSGAPKKTNFYNALAGSGAAVQAGYDANIEDRRGQTGPGAAHDLGGMLGGKHGNDGIWDKMNADLRTRFENEANDPANNREMTALGYNPADARHRRVYAQHRFLEYVRTQGAGVLANVLGGAASNFEIGDLKSAATVFMQRMGSNRRDDTRDAFLQYAPISGPGGIGSPVDESAIANDAVGLRGDELARHLQTDPRVRGLSATQQQDLARKIDNINAAITKLLDDKLEGIKILFDRMKEDSKLGLDEGSALSKWSSTYSRGLDALRNGNLDQALKTAADIAHANPDTIGSGREDLQKFYDRIGYGVDHFKDLRAASSGAFMPQQEWQQYDGMIRGNVNHPVYQDSRVEHVVNNTVQNIASTSGLGDRSISAVVHDDGQLARLTDEISMLAGSIGQIKTGSSTFKAPAYDPSLVAKRVQELAGPNANQSLNAFFNNPENLKRFSKMMSSSIAEGVSKTPQRPSVQTPKSR